VRRFLFENGLSAFFLAIFVVTLVGQSFVGQHAHNAEELAHGGQPLSWLDYILSPSFGGAVLENWQSEFLQLFSFVVLAALYIHKGSAESKDGEENIQASLRRIETHLGTLPESAPSAPDHWKLPETPLEIQHRVDTTVRTGVTMSGTG
jgi:hypothetical protein